MSGLPPSIIEVSKAHVQKSTSRGASPGPLQSAKSQSLRRRRGQQDGEGVSALTWNVMDVAFEGHEDKKYEEEATLRFVGMTIQMCLIVCTHVFTCAF